MPKFTLVATLLLFVINLTAKPAGDGFIKEDWQKALQLAKESKKPIMVDFYTEWCGWCEVMDEKTFSEKTVAQKLKDDYVTIKLDAERGIGRKVAMKYRVSSYPTTGFFTFEGKPISFVGGYIEAEPFLNILDSLKQYNKENLVKYPGMSDELDPGFPEFYKAAFNINGKRKFPAIDTLRTWFDNQEDKFSEVYFAVLSRFQTPEKPKQHFLEHREKYASLYGEEAVEGVVFNFVNTDFYKTTKKKPDLTFEELKANLHIYILDDAKRADLEKNLTLIFYSRTEEWQKLADFITSDIASFTNSTLNDQAWSIYEECVDKKVIKQAYTWMKPVIEEEPIHMYIDTYAALAFKLGYLEEAEKEALRAIKIGRENGDKVGGTKALLGKIRLAKLEY